MRRKLTIIIGIFFTLPCWQGLFPGQTWLLELSAIAAPAQTPKDTSAKVGFWKQFKSILAKSKSDDHTPLSVTDKFPAYYEWVHQKDQRFYDSLSRLGVVNWDKYQNIVDFTYKRDKDSTLTNKLSRKYKVFGWHPYWMGSAYKAYHFEYLSYLSWFSYNVDPATGKYNNPDVIEMWKNSTELFQLAKANGCKVLLTITSHSKIGNDQFLSDLSSQDVLIDSLISLLKGRGDGIDVNFEQIRDGRERELTIFLNKLSTQLKKYNYVLTVDLPIKDDYNNYLFDQLKGVDLFIVTGYDYFYPGSKSDGPVAPLDLYNNTYSIQASVNQYLRAGLPRKKLLLGLPYYGAIWTSKSSKQGQADSTQFNRHITYREIKARYGNSVPQYDFERWGAFQSTYNYELKRFEKCWYDDTITLGRKFNWVRQEQLAGVGIWALGYDYGNEDMWDLIKKTMVADSVLVYGEPYLESRQFKLGRSLWIYRSLVAVAGIFLVVFIISGLVVALFDWRVREVFFYNKTLRLLYSFAAIAVILSIFAFYLFVTEKPVLNNQNLFGLGIGLCLGVGIALVIGFFHQKWTDSLP